MRPISTAGRHLASALKKPRKPSSSAARVLGLSIATVAGTLAGILCAVGWGENFKMRSLVVEGLGKFYRVALPADIRTLNDIRLAEIAAPSASDYERVGVNNYWIASSENLPRIIGSHADLAVIRNHDGALRGALNAFLLGRNFIVYEMENSTNGYCSGKFDVQLNGNTIVGVPMHAPSGPTEILSLLRMKDGEAVRNGFDKVLCSRRIIEIDLEPPPEPLRRIADFIGVH